MALVQWPSRLQSRNIERLLEKQTKFLELLEQKNAYLEKLVKHTIDAGSTFTFAFIFVPVRC